MDWKGKVNVADTVTFNTSGGRVYGNFDRPLTLTSPPFVTSFPKLTKADIERSQDKGIRVINYETDITMKGATETHANFKAFMDDLDELLLAHIVSTDTSINAAQAKFMLKPLFKTRRSIRTGKEYPEAMNCRSKISTENVDRLPVVDSDNKPYLTDIQQDDIIRVQLTYRGPYYIRNSWFGNSWELSAVQFCGRHEEPTPCFHPVDPTEFPTLPK
jgi:hypothetical protein